MRRFATSSGSTGDGRLPRLGPVRGWWLLAVALGPLAASAFAVSHALLAATGSPLPALRLDQTSYTVTISSDAHAPRTVPGLHFVEVNHLDVDGDGQEATLAQRPATCDNHLEIGEQKTGRCEVNPDVRVKVDASPEIGRTIETATKCALENKLATDPTCAVSTTTALGVRLRIDRALSAVFEERPMPQHVRVVAEFTVIDQNNVLPPTKIRFGYQVPDGGTIPTRLTTLVGGLEKVDASDLQNIHPFDPLTVLVDSGERTGGVELRAPTYSGPLALIGGFAQEPPTGSTARPKAADFTTAYAPMPDDVTFVWDRQGADRSQFVYRDTPPGSYAFHVLDSAGTKRPPAPRDVDLTTTLALTEGVDGAEPPGAPEDDVIDTITVGGRIDRLPSEVRVNVRSLTEAGRRSEGEVTYEVPATALGPSGILPDATLALTSEQFLGAVRTDITRVRADAERIPQHLTGSWYIPVKEPETPAETVLGCEKVTGVTDPCKARAAFHTSSTEGAALHVGALELMVANFPEPAAGADQLVPFIPNEAQYVSLQSGPIGAEQHQLLAGRVEDIQDVTFDETADGFEAHTEIGDGSAPLQLHVDTDERTVAQGPADADGTVPKGDHLQVDGTLSPLPNDITLTFHRGDEQAGVPLALEWRGSATDSTGAAKTVNLDARVEQRSAESLDPAAPGAPPPACGEPFTLCADLEADHVPPAVDISYLKTGEKMRLDVDADPGDVVDPTLPPEPGAETLDVAAKLASRSTPEDSPFQAEFDLRALPQELTALVATPIKDPDPTTPEIEDADPTTPEFDVEHRLTRVEVHPCTLAADDRSCTRERGVIGEAHFAVRNFVNRPLDPLPPSGPQLTAQSPVAVTDHFLTALFRDAAASRDAGVPAGLLFEVTGRVADIREVQYLSPEGITAGRVRIGDGAKSFSTLVDARDVELSDGEGAQDLVGELVIERLPTSVDFCFRGGGERIDATPPPPFDPLTTDCENAAPFPETGQLGRYPTSVVVETAEQFPLLAHLRSRSDGDDRAPGTVDDEQLQASLELPVVPNDLHAYIQAPDKGDATHEPGDQSLRARLTTAPVVLDPGDPRPLPIVDLSFGATDGDLTCTDPRTPAVIPAVPDDPGTPDVDESRERRIQEALCAKGVLEHLPTVASLFFDASKPSDNIRIANDGGGQLALRDARFSSIKGEFDTRNTPDPSDDVVLPQVLLVEGSVTGIPEEIEGNLVLPGTAEFFVTQPDPPPPTADLRPSVATIDVQVRNFIAPDPMPSAPPQRAPDLDGDGVDDPFLPATERVEVFQRNDLFRADVHVTKLVKAGYAAGRDADGNELDTKKLTLDFGASDAVIRVYADLLALEEDDPGTPEREDLLPKSIIADAVLMQKPAGAEICIRGEPTATAPPVVPTFCDTGPGPEDGAFEILTQPYPPTAAPEPTLDVDAFIRYAKAGGAGLLTAAVRVDNVPLAVRGIFNDDGNVDVATYGARLDGDHLVVDESTPVGIDRVRAELANFDLLPGGHGYYDSSHKPAPPWRDSVPGPTVPIDRAPIDNGGTRSEHFVRLRVEDDLFYTQVGLGRVGGPDTEMHRFRIAGAPCTNTLADAHFPHLPPDGSDYTCIRTKFVPRDGVPADDPLLVDLIVDKDGERFTLNGPAPGSVTPDAPDGTPSLAGLTKIPDEFQVSLAKTSELAADSSLRHPCGDAVDYEADDTSCMPPLLHLNVVPTSAGEPSVFGMVEIGAVPDIRGLRAREPFRKIANGHLSEPPGIDGFVEDGWTDGHGIRLKLESIGDVEDPNAPPEEPVSTDHTTIIAGVHLPVPASFTLDQIQNWTCTTGDAANGIDPNCFSGDGADPAPDGEDQPQNQDVALRYTARDADGDLLPSLGELAGMMDAGGQEILLNDPGAPETRGVLLPGEFGLHFFRRGRWDPAEGSVHYKHDFFQIDVRASAPLGLGVRLPVGEDDPAELRAGLTGLPTNADITQADIDAAALSDPHNPLPPAFRLRAEMISSVDTDDGGSFSDCHLILLCIKTDADLNTINADIDFSGARRVDAVINQADGKNGLELRGYGVLHGTDPHDEMPINGSAYLDVDPFSLYFHAIVPLVVVNVVSVMYMNTELFAHLDFTDAAEFSLRNDGNALTVSHAGPFESATSDHRVGGEVHVDPDMYPYVAFGITEVFTLWWGTAYGFVYAWIPGTPPQMAVDYLGCSEVPVVQGEFGEFHVSNDTKEVYGLMGLDPRLVKFGALSTVNWLRYLIPYLIPVTGVVPEPMLGIGSYVYGCLLADASPGAIPLADPDENVPGPAISIDHHPVPSFDPEDTSGVSPPPPPPPEPADLDVTGPVALCGPHNLGTVTVRSGGQLTVATAADATDLGGVPRCAAADVGALQLVAASLEVHAGGVVDVSAATSSPSISGRRLTVSGADSAAGLPAGRIVAGAQVLRLGGHERLEIDGVVTADALVTATSGGAVPTGNSGAGHGAAGGAGSSGTPGSAYGDASTEPDDEGFVPLTAGSVGATAGSAAAGSGGGRIDLTGGVVRIAGQVSALGASGASDTSGACAVLDDPDTAGDESMPNTGRQGAGGGSGGSISINAVRLDATGGTISARGGNGGSGKAGGGGGGAGGVVKLIAPIATNASPVVSGGSGGGTAGCPESAGGASGGSGPVVRDATPRSVASLPGDTFTQRGTGTPLVEDGHGVSDPAYRLEVPVSGAAEVGRAYQIQLCGLHRPPEASIPSDEDDPDSRSENYGIDMPDPNPFAPASQPCGTATGDTSLVLLGSTTVDTSDGITTDGETIDTHPNLADQADNGFWGLFSVALRPATDGNDCLDHTDFSFPPFLTGTQYDDFDCVVEPLPEGPDAVMLVDNVAPSATVAAPTESSSETIHVGISGVSDSLPRQDDATQSIPNLSGVFSIECGTGPAGATDPTAFDPCQAGQVSVTLPTPPAGADQTATLFVRVTDAAGNIWQQRQEVALDLHPPASTAALVADAGSEIDNGWFHTTPTFVLDGFDDGDGSGPADRPFEYWFDGGPHTFCGTSATPTCSVDQEVSNGQHEFHWRAIDRAGHTEAIRTLAFKVDADTPEAALLTAPFEADGATPPAFDQEDQRGWFVTSPWVVVSAFDDPAGSGLVRAPSDADPGAGTYLGVAPEATPDAAVALILVDPSVPPRRLEGGSHKVCVAVQDVAGNRSDTSCDVIHVDADDPTVTLTPAGASGEHGWFTGITAVTAAVGDAPGSGVETSPDAGSETLCGPKVVDPDLPSTVCVSIDGHPFEPVTSVTLDTDERHDVQAFAVDRAGRQSRVAARLEHDGTAVQVDLTDPVPTVRTFPPSPVGTTFRHAPLVTLGGIDAEDGSGLSINAQRDPSDDAGLRYQTCKLAPLPPGSPPACSGFAEYVAPFAFPGDGQWRLDVEAEDFAGRVGSSSTVFRIDTTPPLADAQAPFPDRWTRTPAPVVNPVPTNPVQLSWTASDPDNLSAPVQVEVIVYGVLDEFALQTTGTASMRAIRSFDLNPDLSPTAWDGRAETLQQAQSRLEPVPACILTGVVTKACDPGLPWSGRYYYRIIVTDAAGNVAISDDSELLEILQ